MEIKTEKEYLLNKIEQLEIKAKSLSVDVDLLRKRLGKVNFEEQEYKRWRANEGEDYWYVGYTGNIHNDSEAYTEQDNFRYSIGNYFKTREEAEEYKENLITKQKLKDLALKLNEGVEIDWKSTYQTKYSLYLDIDEDLDSDSCCIIKATSQIYCLNKNFLDIAKEEIGEEALIKLIKSGV